MRQTVWFLILFCVIHLVLAGFFIDEKPTPNPTSRVLPVLTYFEENTLKIDKYHDLSNDKSYVNGHYYSDKAPLSSFLVMPIFGMLRSLKLAPYQPNDYGGYHVQVIGDLLCGVIPFVLLLLFSFKALKNTEENTEGSVSPVLLATLPFYSSFVFLYSGTFFGHNLAAAFLVGSYLCLKYKRYFPLSGFLLGASILSEYTVGIIFPVWLLQVYRNEGRSRAIQFLVGTIPSFIVLAFYNLSITGIPWKSPYAFHADPQFAQLHSNYGFALPHPEALWGLSLSPYRGMIFYTPILILMGYLVYQRRRNLLHWGALASNYVFSASVLTFLLISSHFTWWGGWCYGPRYLVNMAALLLYEGVCFLSGIKFSRAAFFALSFFGLVQVGLAKSTVLYMVPEFFKFPLFELFIPNLRKGDLNPDNILTLAFGVRPWIAIVIWMSLFVIGNWVLVRWYRSLRLQSSLLEKSRDWESQFHVPALPPVNEY